MADAGRILIMPKGTYDASVSYEMLDLVFHNDVSWIAKKPVIGVEPSDANADYWFKMVDNSGLQNILNGTTAVGNALKLNGFTFYKSYTEIDSTFTNQTPLIDITNAMVADSRFIVTVYNGSTSVYPSGLGILEINKHSTTGNYTSVQFIDRPSGKLYTGAVQNGVFTGWKYSADGGNADTVNGLHASAFVRGASPFFSSGETVLGWANNPNGVYKKMALTEIGIPSDGVASASGFYTLDVDDGARKLVTFHAWASNVTKQRAIWQTSWKDSDWKITGIDTFLPLDGSVPMSGVLKLGNDTQILLAELHGGGEGGYIDFFSEGNRVGGITVKKNGNFVFYDTEARTVLHTGNSQKVVTSASAPSDTTALWVVPKS